MIATMQPHGVTAMPETLPDIYVTYADGLIALQGASQAAIDHLRPLYPLSNGTTALVAPESAEDAFERIDAAGLRTLTF